MKGLHFTHEGELTEKGKKKLEELKKSSEVSIEKSKEEYKAMILPEKEGMFPSDDDLLLGQIC